MLTRLLAAALVALGTLALGIAIVTTGVQEVAENSPFAFLVDAELRQLSKRSAAVDIHFEARPQDGTSASVDRLFMTPVDMATTLAEAHAYLLREGGYRAEETDKSQCPIADFPDGCTTTFHKTGVEVEMQRRAGMLVISKFALR